MEDKEFISVTEFAKILGLSRMTVHNKIKKGQIKAIRIGRSYAIPKEYINNILGKSLSEKDKQAIDRAVKKTFKEFGEVIIKLGRE